MKYVPSSGWEEGITALSERLSTELTAGKRVLWLVSGGSNIAATVKVMSGVPEELTSSLTVMPNDERYGEPGHPDSNWQQLLDAGFQAKQAKTLPVLKAGMDFEATARAFEATARQAFAGNDVIISQLGMGPDGHVSGILPASPAAGETEAWVTAYEQPPLKRITLTFPALREATAIYLFAFGADKRPALEILQNKAVPLADQPAQILKEIREAYVYSDQLEAA
jgi:6-phosphogluconolactonase/glucosamine-6-phosphate isomerase/deaminase